MGLEEEHETMHHRGEMTKFLILLLALVGAVLVIALLRPLIFDRVVPAVLGWDQEPGVTPGPGPLQDAPAASTNGDEAPLVMTATPPAMEGTASDVPGNAGAPLPTPRFYEVQAGDTLAQIAVRFGMSTETLAKANGIGDPHRIQVGDRLVIPNP